MLPGIWLCQAVYLLQCGLTRKILRGQFDGKGFSAVLRGESGSIGFLPVLYGAGTGFKNMTNCLGAASKNCLTEVTLGTETVPRKQCEGSIGIFNWPWFCLQKILFDNLTHSNNKIGGIDYLYNSSLMFIYSVLKQLCKNNKLDYLFM